MRNSMSIFGPLPLINSFYYYYFLIFIINIVVVA